MAMSITPEVIESLASAGIEGADLEEFIAKYGTGTGERK